MREMIAFTGNTVRAAKLFGWCVLVGSTLREGESAQSAVSHLVKWGLSQAKAYEVCDEIRAFKTHLEGIEHRSRRVEDVLTEIREQASSPIVENRV